MSAPPGFDAGASMLPDNQSATIHVMRGGANTTNTQNLNYTTKQTHILSLYGLDAGGIIADEIDEPTKIAFLQQLESGACNTNTGDSAILKKDCWAVVAVIRALILYDILGNESNDDSPASVAPPADSVAPAPAPVVPPAASVASVASPADSVAPPVASVAPASVAPPASAASVAPASVAPPASASVALPADSVAPPVAPPAASVAPPVAPIPEATPAPTPNNNTNIVNNSKINKRLSFNTSKGNKPFYATIPHGSLKKGLRIYASKPSNIVKKYKNITRKNKSILGGKKSTLKKGRKYYRTTRRNKK